MIDTDTENLKVADPNETQKNLNPLNSVSSHVPLESIETNLSENRGMAMKP
jgi:hypothetical protein